MDRLLAPRVARCAILILLLLTATSQAQSHRIFDISMNGGELAKAYGHWEMTHHRSPAGVEKILVPMLEIYSSDGHLIYHGTQGDTARAPQVLGALPAHPYPPPSPETQMSLDEILEMTPSLAKLKPTIVGDHRFVVVSISMQGHWSKSNAYSEQNHAVESIPKRQGVDIDVVRIYLSF